MSVLESLSENVPSGHGSHLTSELAVPDKKKFIRRFEDFPPIFIIEKVIEKVGDEPGLDTP